MRHINTSVEKCLASQATLGVVLLCPNRAWPASTTHLQLVSVWRVPSNQPLSKAGGDPSVICESARPTRVSTVGGRGGLPHCVLAVFRKIKNVE